MNINLFGESVGTKFKEDQSVAFFPGNTIVSLITEEMDYHKYMVRIADMLRANPASHCFSFLPPESYHMTTIEGVCDHVRKADYWTKHLSVDVPLVQVDDYFEEKFKQIKPLGEVTMIADGLVGETGAGIKLKPKTIEDEKKLERYRNEVRDVLGLEFPNHYCYGFHSSLVYFTKRPTMEEFQEIEKLISNTSKYIKENPVEFVVKEPSLTFFDNMFYFSVNRVDR